VRVAEAYAALLARSPGVDETAYWAGVARAGGTTAMRSGIMATQEYWNRAGVRF
jgi:hypothetical protein